MTKDRPPAVSAGIRSTGRHDLRPAAVRAPSARAERYIVGVIDPVRDSQNRVVDATEGPAPWFLVVTDAESSTPCPHCRCGQRSRDEADGRCLRRRRRFVRVAALAQPVGRRNDVVVRPPFTTLVSTNDMPVAPVAIDVYGPPEVSDRLTTNPVAPAMKPRQLNASITSARQTAGAPPAAPCTNGWRC